jgi:hypothetical protein
LPGTGEGGGEPEAKKYILFLPATKALFIPAVFAIGVVILAVYFFFAPDTRRALVQPGHFNQSVLVETSGDSNSNTEIPEAERKAAADAKAEADRLAAQKAEAERKAAADAKAPHGRRPKRRKRSKRRRPTLKRKQIASPHRGRPTLKRKNAASRCGENGNGPRSLNLRRIGSNMSRHMLISVRNTRPRQLLITSE